MAAEDPLQELHAFDDLGGLLFDGEIIGRHIRLAFDAVDQDHFDLGFGLELDVVGEARSAKPDAGEVFHQDGELFFVELVHLLFAASFAGGVFLIFEVVFDLQEFDDLVVPVKAFFLSNVSAGDAGEDRLVKKRGMPLTKPGPDVDMLAFFDREFAELRTRIVHRDVDILRSGQFPKGKVDAAPLLDLKVFGFCYHWLFSLEKVSKEIIGIGGC